MDEGKELSALLVSIYVKINIEIRGYVILETADVRV